MAQHKAPTAVSVAPVQEKSGAGLWIAKNWMYGALLAVAIVAFLVFRHQRNQSQLEAKDSSWEKVVDQLERDPQTGAFKGDPTALAALATDLKDTSAGPAARLGEAEARFQLRDYDGALTALEALERDHATHPYVVTKYKVGDQDLTLVQNLKSAIADMKAFDASHPGLYANPDPAADAPRVRLNTELGAIVVALYPAKAPKHCENFLKLCKEGYYAGTKFHRVLPKFLIGGGDPNSKAGEAATWGQGGPGYKLDVEPSDIAHFAGTLGMHKLSGDSQSSGSQFYITTEPLHGFDNTYTAFGKVVEGMDVVKRIAAVATTPNSDRPLAPVVLTTAEVLPQ